jgi:O-antigen ligase
VTLADTMERAKALAWTLVASMGYLCFELNLEYLRGTNTLHEYGFGGMDNNSAAISIVTVIAPAGFLGLYERRLWARGIAWLSAALAGHAVLLAFSRGGLLGLILSGLAAVVILPKRPKYLVPVLVAALLGLRFAGPQVRDRFATTFDQERRGSSAESRLVLWQSCVELMQQHPLFGVGPDHFPHIASDLGFSKGKEAHTLWLQLGAEIGVPGLVFLMLFYGTAVWRLRPFLRRPPPDDLGQWVHITAAMVTAGIVGFAVSAQFVSLKGLETPFFLVAIGVATLRLSTQRAPQEAVAPAPVVSAVPTVKPLPSPVYRPSASQDPSGRTYF